MYLDFCYKLLQHFLIGLLHVEKDYLKIMLEKIVIFTGEKYDTLTQEASVKCILL